MHPVTRIYALANQKGGVGKTTTAINLAACLAEAGERALVVDLDPQANATSGLGERANGSSSIDLLDGVPLRDLAKPTRFANLDLVPAKPDLAGTAAELARRGDGERYLAEALAASGDYTFVSPTGVIRRRTPSGEGRDGHRRSAAMATRGRAARLDRRARSNPSVSRSGIPRPNRRCR